MFPVWFVERKNPQLLHTSRTKKKIGSAQLINQWIFGSEQPFHFLLFTSMHNGRINFIINVSLLYILRNISALVMA